jgi:hypothetical protein
MDNMCGGDRVAREEVEVYEAYAAPVREGTQSTDQAAVVVHLHRV